VAAQSQPAFNLTNQPYRAPASAGDERFVTADFACCGLRAAATTARVRRSAQASPDQSRGWAGRRLLQLDGKTTRRPVNTAPLHCQFLKLVAVNIFTLEIDGRPTIVFDATSIEEARGICALPEFRADLSALTADGSPVCGDASALTVRDASGPEVAAFQVAVTELVASDGPTMAFLVRVDGVVVTVTDPD
jgi:hypothetical protein